MVELVMKIRNLGRGKENTPDAKTRKESRSKLAFMGAVGCPESQDTVKHFSPYKVKWRISANLWETGDKEFRL